MTRPGAPGRRRAEWASVLDEITSYVDHQNVRCGRTGGCTLGVLKDSRQIFSRGYQEYRTAPCPPMPPRKRVGDRMLGRRERFATRSARLLFRGPKPWGNREHRNRDNRQRLSHNV